MPVTMGALASLEQREEVLRALKALSASATIVSGDPNNLTVTGADAQGGAFLPPILLRCDDSAATAPHDVEAFGPVSTVLAYDNLDDAVTLAARGVLRRPGLWRAYRPAAAPRNAGSSRRSTRATSTSASVG